MSIHTHEFATKPEMLRRALQENSQWIEAQLGAPSSELAILETSTDLTRVAADRVLGCGGELKSRALRRFRSFVASAEIPSDRPPVIELDVESMVDLRSFLDGSAQNRQSKITWGDAPVAFRLRNIDSPVIALNVPYHSGPQSGYESVARILVVRREFVAQLVHFMQQLVSRDGEPRLHVVGGSERRIVRCEWDELVLDQNVLSLLRDDFEAFFAQESFFRRNRLPFRRGYLLHGPPGNGKSTAVRAMLTSRGLTAYTLRLFDPHTEDGDLDLLFEKALKNRPSMVLFEDIDRAFPRTGEPKARVSMQNLLNCLDGVGTGEGIIVVATANEPTTLDPAILRRPGRFDRVVHFPDPDAELREKYFRRMAGRPEEGFAQQAVTESEGFSFAQLREAYILAGQHAFAKSSEITENDLLAATRMLRLTLRSGSKWSKAAGFKPAVGSERGDT